MKVIGRDVDVLYKADLEELGFCHSDRLCLEVRDGLPPSEEKDVVLHETIHLLSDLGSLSLSERQVRVLATLLVGLFWDNPALASYLTTKQ